MSDGQAQPFIPAAPVSILDVYRVQVEMQGSLAVIHEQLKAIPDHEARIRQLEASRSRLAGACVTLSLAISIAGTWLGALVSHH